MNIHILISVDSGKDFSMQTVLASYIDKWKQIIGHKGYRAAILLDLSKVFDTVNLEVLIPKLHDMALLQSLS